MGEIMKNENFGKRVYNFEDLMELCHLKKSVIGDGGMFTKTGNWKDKSLPFAERIKSTGLKHLPAAVVINMCAMSVHNMLKKGLYIYITKKELKENE